MKRLFLLIPLWILTLQIFAQSNVTLTFTAQQINEEYQKLDSILVINKTRGWSEMLYYPDTTYSISTVGISEYQKENHNAIKLHQNTPNPFIGITDFHLTMTEKEKVSLMIVDINGKKVAEYQNTLSRGEHTFRAILSTPQTYLLSATSKDGSTAIKMINLSNSGKQCRIEHTGYLPISSDIIKKECDSVMVIGDEMRYIGYTTQASGVHTDSISKTLQNSEKIIFTFPEIKHVQSIKLYAQDATSVSYRKATLNAYYDYQYITVIGTGFLYKKDTDAQYTTIYTSRVSTPFHVVLNALEPNTNYSYKAFARIPGDTLYTEEFHFTTMAVTETDVLTDTVTDIAHNTATLHGSYVAIDESQISEVGFEICSNDTVWNTYTVTPKSASFNFILDQLKAETDYQYKAFAKLTSTGEKIYGDIKNFTTAQDANATTRVATLKADTRSFNHRAAKIYGQVVATGQSDITEAGFYWGTSETPETTGSKVVVSDYRTDFNYTTDTLSFGTTYYYVAYAINNEGTTYGTVESFTTATFNLPKVTVLSIEDLKSDRATITSKVLNFGGSENLTVGIAFSDSKRKPTIEDQTSGTELIEIDSTYTLHLYPLKKNTIYHARAYAQNEEGITYSNVVAFRTSNEYACGDPIQDNEGNKYATVLIGKQCWMAEDLRTKTMPDGKAMEELKTGANYTSGRYYYEIPSSDKIAGGSILYPWTTACNSQYNTDQSARIPGICPEGWFIPTYRDVAELCRFIDPEWNDGGESFMPKSTDNPCLNSNNHLAIKLASPKGHWYYYNTGEEYSTPDLSYNQTPNTPGYYQPNFNHADFNTSGFNAVPKGYWSDGNFTFDGKFSFWTAISNLPSAYGNVVKIALDKTGIEHQATNNSAKNGYSVRCVKATQSSLVKYTMYENFNGTSTPFFNTLKNPTRIGYTDCMDLEGIPGEDADHYAVMFEYELNVDKEENYTFRLVSDDGGRLTVDGKRIIYSGGYHLAEKVLAPGKHSICVEFMEYNRSQCMNLAYKTPGTDFQTLGYQPQKGIPDFVVPQAKETLKRVKEWKGNDEAIVFPIITDIHTSCRDTYKHIGYTVYMDKYFNYDFMVNLGDIGLNGKPSTEDRTYSLQIWKNTLNEMSKYKGVFLYAPGNHDYDGGEKNHITAAELSEKIQKPAYKYAKGNLHIEPNNTFCYYDLPEKHTRFILLNSQIEEVSGTHTYHLGFDQLNWLKELLQSTPEGTNVLIMQHWMPDDIGRWPNVKCNKDTASTSAFMELLTAYSNKTKGEKNGLSWDFTNANGSLIGLMTGDSHVNAYVKKNDVNLMILQGYGRVENTNMTPGTKRSTFNARTSLNIDLIVIKPKTKEVHSFRIGAGGKDMDMQFSY